ncbi:hypothetical protein B0O80DRAFT_435226 [Mortierella sp. GBAus27b]|nr:hypothetical protein B0O80DRAFT_435226 [Mortierella sp. GBAus27b]
MADRNRDPEPDATTAHRSTTKPPASHATSASTAARRTTAAATTTTTTTRAARASHSGVPITATSGALRDLDPTPTSTAGVGASGGSSGAVMGGIAVGGVAVVALVGLLFYKRRKRASLDTPKGGRGDKGLGMDVPVNMVSGPMALAPEDGIEAAPSHRPEAQFREQQQFPPGMRDELFGTGLHSSPSNKKENDALSRGNSGSSNKNAAPAPEYYMGKEDIDPRRDLRGLDAPETYVKMAQAAAGGAPADRLSQDSPRSSTDSGSVYLTMEEAQQAHNQKMMGHKQSIGSVGDLLENQSSRPPGDRMVSVATTQSSMSMMPPLPPVASPAPFNGINHQNQYQQQQPPMEDPYAEGAFSETQSDAFYNPAHYEIQQHPSLYQSDSFSAQPPSPTYQGHSNNSSGQHSQAPVIQQDGPYMRPY